MSRSSKSKRDNIPPSISLSAFLKDFSTIAEKDKQKKIAVYHYTLRKAKKLAKENGLSLEQNFMTLVEEQRADPKSMYWQGLTDQQRQYMLQHRYMGVWHIGSNSISPSYPSSGVMGSAMRHTEQYSQYYNPAYDPNYVAMMSGVSDVNVPPSYYEHLASPSWYDDLSSNFYAGNEYSPMQSAGSIGFDAAWYMDAQLAQSGPIIQTGSPSHDPAAFAALDAAAAAAGAAISPHNSQTTPGSVAPPPGLEVPGGQGGPPGLETSASGDGANDKSPRNALEWWRLWSATVTPDRSPLWGGSPLQK